MEGKADVLVGTQMVAKGLDLPAVTIVGVITISESGGQQPQPIFMAREEASFAAADSSFSTPVLAGQVELSVFVNIQYEIE